MKVIPVCFVYAGTHTNSSMDVTLEKKKKRKIKTLENGAQHAKFFSLQPGTCFLINIKALK